MSEVGQVWRDRRLSGRTFLMLAERPPASGAWDPSNTYDAVVLETGELTPFGLRHWDSEFLSLYERVL